MDTVLAAFHLALLGFAGAVLIAAAIGDVRDRRIPNGLSALLLVLYPLFIYSAPTATDWQRGIVLFFIVGLFGFGLFLCGLMGAGDVKLLATIALWAGLPHLALLLLVTVLAGGVVSLAVLVWSRLRRGARVTVPYGVAIATGGCAVLCRMALPHFPAFPA